MAIGVTYGRLGACALWQMTLGVWALQFVPLAVTWTRLANAVAVADPAGVTVDIVGPFSEAAENIEQPHAAMYKPERRSETAGAGPSRDAARAREPLREPLMQRSGDDSEVGSHR